MVPAMTTPAGIEAPAEPATITQIRTLDQAGHAPRAIATQLGLPSFRLAPVLALADDDLTTRHRAGQSIADISADVGLPPRLIRCILIRDGEHPTAPPKTPDPQVSGRPTLPSKVRAKTGISLTRVWTLHEETHTVEDIARHYNTTPEHIAQLLAITDDDLTRMYDAGQTIQEIAEHLDVARGSVHRVLKNADVTFRPSSKRPWSQAVAERAIALYKDGKAIREVAANLGVSHSAVHSILTEYNVPRRPPTRYGLITAAEKTAILAAHDAGHTPGEIARMMSRSDFGVRYVLKTHGKTPNRHVSPVRANIDDIARRYAEGASMTRIGAQYGTTYGTISAHLKAHGIAVRSPRNEPLTDRKRTAILDAYRSQEPVKHIVTRLHTSLKTIYTVVDAAGAPRRNSTAARRRAEG
ncbi:hypothetical protein [Streptosporangium sp. NPDC051022]|uniref:helix-turn-helix domain-containing protein n=1 Tax=Streptosporangium sp. NPDC051022 TaxID=3155752 RepID=UPI00342B36F0